MSYKHLSLEERHYIKVRKDKGRTLTEIAKDLNRSQSTISRELKRNTGGKGYRYKQDQNFAENRHISKPKDTKLSLLVLKH